MGKSHRVIRWANSNGVTKWQDIPMQEMADTDVRGLPVLGANAPKKGG
jgi:hypothetical protein